MNVFFFEIRSYLRSAITWTISIIVVFILMMYGLFPLYMDAAATLDSVLENFPPAFAQAFGIAINNMFSFGGFYNFAFGYLALMAGIMAVCMAITVFAREKKSKSMDFILTKPISRAKLFQSKLFACVAILLTMNVLYEIFFLFVYQSKGANEVSLAGALYAGAGIFFTQLIFLAFGILFSVTAKKIRSISGVGTIFGITAFILSSLANVLEEEKIYYISPLKYFEPDGIFKGENYEVGLIIASILIIAVCLGIAYRIYIKSDTHQL